jgi:choline-glycine betaine transporter
LAVLVITCIQIVVVALFLVKADERQAFMTKAQAWIADNTGLLVGIMLVVALIYFAILYFTSGWFSRWFAKRLNASVRP